MIWLLTAVAAAIAFSFAAVTVRRRYGGTGLAIAAIVGVIGLIGVEVVVVRLTQPSFAFPGPMYYVAVSTIVGGIACSLSVHRLAARDELPDPQVETGIAALAFLAGAFLALIPAGACAGNLPVG